MNLLDKPKDYVKWVIIADKKLDPDIKNSFKHYYDRRIERKSGQEETFFDHIDAALGYAGSKSYKYCLVNWEGLLIRNQPEYYMGAVKHIHYLNEQGSWLVSGHIIDDESSFNHWNPGQSAVTGSKWYYFWPITCIVNLEEWHQLGKPKFGDKEVVNYSSLPAVNRSDSNIHDNYTPNWIKAAGGKNNLDKLIELKSGWNLLKTSLDNGMSVYNIPFSMRSESEYTYPENNIEEYNKTMKFVQDANSTGINFKLVKTMLDLTVRMTNTAFNCFNSEGLGPAINIERYHDNYKHIDTIVYPTQGFKDFVYSFGNICKHQHAVNFIHYDLTLDAIRKRQEFIENWDLTFDYMVKNKLVNFNQSYRDSWEELISHFDSYEHLAEHWEKYKNCNHYYVAQNLMTELSDQNIKKLLDKIGAKNVMFMYSDIFPWESNLLVRGIENLQNMEEKLIQHIKDGRGLLLTESKRVLSRGSEFNIYI